MMEQLLSEINQWLPILIGVIFALILTVVSVVLARRNTKKAKDEYKKLVASLGGEIAGSEIRLPGYDPEVRLWFGVGYLASGYGEGTPSILLSRPLQADFDFEIIQEDFTSKTLQGMGVNIDRNTGSPAFDEKYFFKSSQPDLASIFILTGARRDMIDRLFENGFTKLTLDRNNLYAEKAGYTQADLSPEKIGEYVGILRKFIAG